MAPPNDRKRSFLLRSAVITSAALLTFCKKTTDEPIIYANPKGPVYEPTLDASAPLDLGVTTPEASAPPIAPEDAGPALPPSRPDAAPLLQTPPRIPILYANPKGALYDHGVKGRGSS